MTQPQRDNDLNNSMLKEKKLLSSICEMQQDFMKRGIYYGWCENTFSNLLYLTESEIGFICELLHKEDGTPFIKSHIISNIAWNEETRRFYEERHIKGLEFFNFNSLWGHVFTKGEVVIANNPDNDPRSGEYPKKEGHPQLKSFLGLPIKNSNNQIVGIMAVANRPNGYDKSLVNFLDPFLLSYGLLIETSRFEEQKKKFKDEQEKLIKKLKSMLGEIKTLRGILPLCSFCKKIRDDKGYWEQVDVYIHKYSDADISHSICPECMKEHYLEEYEKIKSDKKEE